MLDRIDSMVRRTGANEPAVGTAAWEARIEIGKINGEIDQIRRNLSQGGLTPYEQAAAQSRLRELDTALTEEAARIPQTDAEARGWVASPARGAQQAAAQGLPEAPAGYHWTAQASGTPRLDRLPGHDNLPQQGYDPATGQFVTRTATPCGGLTAADTADRNAAIDSWMRRQGHDGLTSDNAQAVIAQYRATAALRSRTAPAIRAPSRRSR